MDPQRRPSWSPFFNAECAVAAHSRPTLGYMKLPPLPPLVGPLIEGSVTWDKISDISYTTVGYLLCCHLVLENYIEAFVGANMRSGLSIENARLTFSQKLSILESWELPDQYNFMPSLKHLNSLRNKLGHNIRTVISENELLPLVQFLEKGHEGANSPRISFKH